MLFNYKILYEKVCAWIILHLNQMVLYYYIFAVNIFFVFLLGNFQDNSDYTHIWKPDYPVLYLKFI
jgi:hypothetical protein